MLGLLLSGLMRRDGVLSRVRLSNPFPRSAPASAGRSLGLAGSLCREQDNLGPLNGLPRHVAVSDQGFKADRRSWQSRLLPSG